MFLIINWFNIAICADLKVYENLVPDDVRKNSFLIRERVIDAQILGRPYTNVFERKFAFWDEKYIDVENNIIRQIIFLCRFVSYHVDVYYAYVLGRFLFIGQL